MQFQFGPHGDINLPDDGTVIERGDLVGAYGRFGIMKPQDGCMDNEWALYERHARTIMDTAPAVQRNRLGFWINDDGQGSHAKGTVGPQIRIDHRLFKASVNS